jgi:hypothetical protein
LSCASPGPDPESSSKNLSKTSISFELSDKN